MDAFLISTSVVALAEVGDKTQLLAFLLAARFKKRTPIIAGIFVATLINHGFAGALGQWLGNLLTPEMLRWALGLSLIAMAAWILIPDTLDEEDTQLARLGVFGTTVLAFFMAEMGDKTQVATIVLAAQYDALVAVVCGTTLGMMIANVPAVVLGKKIANALPTQRVHQVAAAIFAILGVLTLFGYGKQMGL